MSRSGGPIADAGSAKAGHVPDRHHLMRQTREVGFGVPGIFTRISPSAACAAIGGSSAPALAHLPSEAAFLPEERWAIMQKSRTLESPEEQEQRLTREAKAKRDELAADEAAIDRKIRLNIAQFGP